MIVETLFLLSVPFAYQGLLALTSMIHDPFGEDILDFPVMAYAENVKDTCCALDLAQQSCPALAPTHAAKFGDPSHAPLSVRSRETFAEIKKRKAAAKAAAATPASAPQPPQKDS